MNIKIYISTEEKNTIHEQCNNILQSYNNDTLNPNIFININLILDKYNLYYSEEFNKVIFTLISGTETSKSLLKSWQNIYAEEINNINNLMNLTELD